MTERCATCGGSGKHPPGNPLYDCDYFGYGTGRLIGWSWASDSSKEPENCPVCHGTGKDTRHD